MRAERELTYVEGWEADSIDVLDVAGRPGHAVLALSVRGRKGGVTVIRRMTPTQVGELVRVLTTLLEDGAAATG